MDIEKALFQALQEATRAGCADIEKAAAAARKKQQQREKVKRAYIAAHGDLVGLVLYREYLEQEEK
jgi:hypothetical protein